jgi:hypothetical protein
MARALDRMQLKPIVMEQDTAKAGVDVIGSSLQKVRDSAACVVLIGRRYGQVLECPIRNSDKLSISAREFNEAYGRPMLLMVMGDRHPLRADEFEEDLVARAKLAAFRERAKRFSEDSRVSWVYYTFNSLREFAEQAIQAAAELAKFLSEEAASSGDSMLALTRAIRVPCAARPPACSCIRYDDEEPVALAR